MHFGAGNYDPAVRAQNIANGQSVQAALAGSPVLAGQRSDSGARVQWAFQDTDLPREYAYAEVVFVATEGGIASPVYLDSAPAAGASLGAKTANTIRQWVLQVAIATGEITVYETRISVPGASEDSPGVVQLGSANEARAAAPPADKVGSLARTLQQIEAWWNRAGSGALAAINQTLTAYGQQIQSLITNKANINSPVLTGEPRAPTPATGDSSTRIATTAFASRTTPVDLFFNANGQRLNTNAAQMIDVSPADIDNFRFLEFVFARGRGAFPSEGNANIGSGRIPVALITIDGPNVFLGLVDGSANTTYTVQIDRNASGMLVTLNPTGVLDRDVYLLAIIGWP